MSISPFLSNMPIVIRIGTLRHTPAGTYTSVPEDRYEFVWARLPNSRVYPPAGSNLEAVPSINKLSSSTLMSLTGASKLVKQRSQV